MITHTHTQNTCEKSSLNHHLAAFSTSVYQLFTFTVPFGTHLMHDKKKEKLQKPP